MGHGIEWRRAAVHSGLVAVGSNEAGHGIEWHSVAVRSIELESSFLVLARNMGIRTRVKTWAI